MAFMPSFQHEALLQLFRDRPELVVLGPSTIPEITDKEQALKDPELAVLSAMAHANDPDTMKSIRIAEVARRALQDMNLLNYEYQSEFARRYYGQGEAKGRRLGHEEGRTQGLLQGRLEGLMEGHAEGRAEGHAVGHAEGRVRLVLKLLAAKYGELPAAVTVRVREATEEDIDEIAERVLIAATLDEAVGVLTYAQS
jgi:predicted transposase YdaD